MSEQGFRADIQGMRAIAIGAVLLSHAGLGIASGGYVGVDVFFVISGFLITGLLVRELDSTGRISLGGFYARRVRRLLPLAALVLGVVVVLSHVFLDPVRAESASGDVLSAIAYVANWRFEAQSIDYFAQNIADSPVLHYWSLAIEEQFYIVWPIVILGLVALVRGRRSTRGLLLAAVSIIGIGSFAYCVWAASALPGGAYFSTLSRAWELALGAVLALVALPALRPRPAAILGIVGLVAIGYAVVTYDSSTTFPGVAALLPTLGAAALIVAGAGAARTGAWRLLATAPFQHVGRLSYAWYLWHWPALIFATAQWGPLSAAEGLVVVAASWIPTVISHHLIEEPVRRSRWLTEPPRRALALWSGTSAAIVTGALVLVVVQPSVDVLPASEVTGAASVADEPIQRDARAVRPDPAEAGGDRGRPPRDDCFVPAGDVTLRDCAYGNADAKQAAVLLGDSHAMQYFPAINRITRSKGWRLIVMTKAGCPAVLSVKRGLDEPSECDRWRDLAFERIRAERPGLVVLSSASGYRITGPDGRLGDEEADAEREQGYIEAVRRIRRVGARVAIIKDPPRAPWDVPGCVLENLRSLERCTFPPPEGYETTFDSRAAKSAQGATLVDLAGVICPEDTCRSVIGNALVYRDNGHLTATFAATLRGAIRRQLPGPLGEP